MKTLYNYPFFFSLHVAVVLLMCCQPDNGHPCDTATISTTYLDDKYDSLFPYSHNSKKLTYLYSNDTITNDTMVFELVEYVNWDIDTTSAERCFIDYQEVQRLFYKSTSSVFKRLIIFRDGGASFKWETREKGESFSYETQKKSDFRIHPSIYFNDNEKHAEIIDNYTVNGHVYNRVYRGLRYFKCDTMGSKLTYSQRYGFLEIFDTCKYELFTFIK